MSDKECRLCGLFIHLSRLEGENSRNYYIHTTICQDIGSVVQKDSHTLRRSFHETLKNVSDLLDIGVIITFLRYDAKSVKVNTIFKISKCLGREN